MDKSEIAYAFAWYFIFIISATFHEAAHAWAAYKGGDPTAYEGGQVSLNPWPHIKRAPVGMVIIPVISIFLIGWPFGWAKTPIDPFWANKNPRKSSWVSLAGPVANLILAAVAFFVIEIGLVAGFFQVPDTAIPERIVSALPAGGLVYGLSIFISMLFSMNLILFVFNLFPVPPLDGSGVVGLFLKEEHARKYDAIISNPGFSLLGIFLAWQVFSPIFSFIFTKMLNVIY